MDGKDKDLDDELRFHLETEAEQQMEAGVPRDEAYLKAKRDFGNVTAIKEQTRQNWTWPRWEQFAQDARYGWRQLIKSKATSAAAILSLALAAGSCLAAFRLIDAFLLRPLPISEPDNLYLVARHGVGPNGKYRVSESSSYPLFREMRAAVAQQAELISVSYAERIDLTYSSDAEMEKAHRQYVSGWMFQNFGLRPALGRLLTESDDQQPGAHPYAVLSYDYWKRRFGADPRILGRTFRAGNSVYEIVGVLAEGFTGTEPGTMIDVFVPSAMMNASTLASDGAFWLRAFVRPKPGVEVKAIFSQLDPVYRAHEVERAKSFVAVPSKIRALKDQLLLEHVAAGVSGMQRDNRLGLSVLAVLVGLVLLIACVNVGNLMMARAMTRGREMALRISIGASRGRLIRLVLVESAWIALLAVALGGLFAAWGAPFVIGMINPADDPARVVLETDWRTMAFGALLAIGVTLVFGLLPAIRVSALEPSSALKGENPHSRGRMMRVLIAAQVAFCFVILFAGGLLTTTYDRLAHQALGFSTERVLALETVVKKPQLPVYWEQLAQRVRSVPGVESVAWSEWPIMSGEMSNRFIAFHGGPPAETLTYFFKVSPGWMETMKVNLLRGRDLRAGEHSPGAAIVNETFARTYFNGDNPVGRSFEITRADRTRARVEIVGLCADARYNSMRDPITPIAYVPFGGVDDRGVEQMNRRGSLNVRTAGANPLALATLLRREVSNFGGEFRVSNLRTQQEIVERHTLRERLLAVLALFFSVVALGLAAVGLYGVLDYSVLQRRREIGIRLAMGAPAAGLATRMMAGTFGMVVLGATVGAALGLAVRQSIEALIYGVKPNDWAFLLLPAAVLMGAALLAAIAPAIRAVRMDPVAILRSN